MTKVLERYLGTAVLALRADAAASRLTAVGWKLARSDHWRTQPRVPPGSDEGGEWTTIDGGGRRTEVSAATWTLLDQRTGLGPDRLIRLCTYIDSAGNMRTITIDAIRLCPPTFPFARGPNAG